MSSALEIVIVLVLLVGNGLLAMSEIALVSVRKARLQQLAQTGRRGARTALRLASDPAEVLSTVQVGITLIGIVAGAFAGTTLMAQLRSELELIPVLTNYAAAISVVVVISAMTFVSLVIGELVPKRLALLNAEAVSVVVARPMLLLAKLAAPVVTVLSFSTNLILRAFGKDIPAKQTITEDEIKIMIGQATKAGVVMESEQDMIEGVLDLGDLQANELMTARHDMVILDVDGSADDNWNKIFDSGHTFFPVVQGDLTQILGLASIKILAEDLVRGRPMNLRTNLIPPLFVPETITALKILEKFKAQKSHLALVVDEYGGVEGIVSINDVLEAVIGELPSLEGDEDQEVVRREDGTWLIDGRISTERLKDHLKIKRLPKKNAGDYNTLGGFIMTQLSRIPRTGDHFTWRGFRFEVVDMDRQRVDKVLVSRLPTPAKSSASGRATKPLKSRPRTAK